MKPISTSLSVACACALVLLAACDREPASPNATPATPSMSIDQPAEDAPPVTPMPGDGQDHVSIVQGRFDGIGPVAFGMDVAQVRTVWGGELDGGPPGSGADGGACFHLSPAQQPSIAWFALMFGDGKFVRYSVANDEMIAPGGGRRGMTETQIEQLYGDGIERQPHKYVEGGEYLRIAAPDGSDHVLIFETDADGRVSEWRVGLPPYVGYVEGCA